jgi:hypothetical protein
MFEPSCQLHLGEQKRVSHVVKENDCEKVVERNKILKIFFRGVEKKPMTRCDEKKRDPPGRRTK